MKDLIAEVIFMFSALATIFIMVLIIVKERRKQKADNARKERENAKTMLRTEPGRLYLD
jgi:hypothetical protein